ncbi:MAG: CoA pyrophosphatase [Limnobacter sp.]|nr:CoA pyrophosphatase [Limnobacter sp.]
MSWFKQLDDELIRRAFARQSDIDWQAEPLEELYFTDRKETQAAVLIPLVTRPEGLTVLLTQRTQHLNAHAGQISFPGGRCEPTDEGPIDTALRETEEETGLTRAHVEVLAKMPKYLTATNFWVTPVVGLVRPDFTLNPDPYEVEEVFETPLSFLMDESNHQKQVLQTPKGPRTVFAMPWNREEINKQYFIWGATATMLRNLHHFLAAGCR